MGILKNNSVGIHLDVGHDSIGWCVTGKTNIENPYVDVLGTGVVLFPADDCLAIKRREFRRQRRHIRSTRQRIARMKALLLSRSILSEKELDANPTASPWRLAARVLSGARRTSRRTLPHGNSWPSMVRHRWQRRCAALLASSQARGFLPLCSISRD